MCSHIRIVHYQHHLSINSLTWHNRLPPESPPKAIAQRAIVVTTQVTNRSEINRGICVVVCERTGCHAKVFEQLEALGKRFLSLQNIPSSEKFLNVGAQKIFSGFLKINSHVLSSSCQMICVSFNADYLHLRFVHNDKHSKSANNDKGRAKQVWSVIFDGCCS